MTHGANFSAPEPLPTTIQKYESDVSIVSGRDNGTFWLGYQSQPTACSAYSSGVTVSQAWDNGTKLSAPALSMPCAAFQYHDREWLGTAPNGTVFQVADVPDGLDSPDLLLARSVDGDHFLPTQILTNNSYIAVGTSAFNDTLWAIGDTTYPEKQCEVLISRDGGSGWSPTASSPPAACSSAPDPATGTPGTEWQLAWGADAGLFVVYVDDHGVEFTESSDLGGTWSSPRLISGAVASGTAFQTPTIAADPASGTLAVAWLDTRAGSGRWGVYMTASDDDGASWEPVREISAGTVGTGPRFWPGDFIGSTLTPWGTDAVVWGGNNSAGILTPYFTQAALSRYSVAFTESGLPVGTSWPVTLNGTTENSTESTIAFEEANGTYAFTIGQVSGYTASPSSGSGTVNGAAVMESVTFTAVGPVTFRVTFTESGLPSGTSWSVTLNGKMSSSTTSAISFTDPNGTYAFAVGAVARYTASPSSGSVTVNGAAVSQSVTFTWIPRSTYTVTFTESGLFPGVRWSVTLNGTKQTSKGLPIMFVEPNGSYAYSILPIAGYSTAYTGQVTVDGAPVSEPVTFVQLTYTVTFAESGLPSATSWSVTVGVTHVNGYTSTSNSIAFSDPNGTYPFGIWTASGYLPDPESGNFTVHGSGVNQTVTFVSPSGGSPSGGFLGFTGATGYYLIGGIIVVVVLGAVIGHLRRRRTRG